MRFSFAKSKKLQNSFYIKNELLILSKAIPNIHLHALMKKFKLATHHIYQYNHRPPMKLNDDTQSFCKCKESNIYNLQIKRRAGKKLRRTNTILTKVTRPNEH